MSVSPSPLLSGRLGTGTDNISRYNVMGHICSQHTPQPRSNAAAAGGPSRRRRATFCQRFSPRSNENGPEPTYSGFIRIFGSLLVIYRTTVRGCTRRSKNRPRDGAEAAVRGGVKVDQPEHSQTYSAGCVVTHRKGVQGGVICAVKEYVRHQKLSQREMFVPLAHHPDTRKRILAKPWR